MWQLMADIIEPDDLAHLVSFLQSSDRFTNGPKVKEFEKVWSEWLGVEFSTMVNSGASANFLSIAIVKELFGVGEVIVPSLGWSSDVSSITQLGMKPVFVDVDPNTMGLQPEALSRAISSNTKAVVVVHALGFNALTKEIQKVLKNHKMFVIEDCCEAHGALIDVAKNKKVGTFGDLSLFSFYYGHHITTIEGGMVSCKNKDLKNLALMFRSHGMTREAPAEVGKRYAKKYPDLNPLFTFALAGFNFRSTELNAVLGLSQIKKLDKNIKARKANLDVWLNSLNPEHYKTDYMVAGNSSFALPLILKEKNFQLKDAVLRELEKYGVEYRLGTAGGGNLARQPFLEKYSYKVEGQLTFVDHIHEFGLYVGNGSHVNAEMVTNLASAVNQLCARDK